MKHGEEEQGGTLYLWRVSLRSSLEIAAYSREEAEYLGVNAVDKATKELLRPERVECLGVLVKREVESEEEQENESPIAEAARIAALSLENKAGGAASELLHDPEGFRADEAMKQKWIRELSEEITREVAAKLQTEGQFKPIPLKEEK